MMCNTIQYLIDLILLSKLGDMGKRVFGNTFTKIALLF